MPEIIVRDRKNLDDYLYEPNTVYSHSEAERVRIFQNFRLKYSCSTTSTSFSLMEMALSSLGRGSARRLLDFLRCARSQTSACLLLALDFKC